MIKRSYEEAFGNQLATGDILGDISFKCLSQRNLNDCSKSNFMLTENNSTMKFCNSRNMDYESFLNIEDCAVMAAAHDIENRKEEVQESPNLEARQIKKVKRRHSNVNLQNSSGSVNNSEPVIDPALHSVDLDDKIFEKMEIEYLEKLSADCKFQISKEKAFVMKKYTDLLINAILTERANETKRIKAENIVLKRAFKIQDDLLKKSKDKGEEIQTENTSLKYKLEELMYENRLMASKLREYQLQESKGYGEPNNHHPGWGGGGIPGF
jgi:hypothetical protein